MRDPLAAIATDTGMDHPAALFQIITVRGRQGIDARK
jgi:hypothetical protein